MAQPSSQVAWTAETLNFVKAGNAQKGRELAKPCAGCHGAEGISSAKANPSLAGQMANYLYKQLLDYKNGNRQNPMMSAMASSLSPQDAADLAVYFAGLKPAVLSGVQSDPYAKAQKLVKEGNSERVLPPCEVCHGSRGQGQERDIPALSGQNAEYLTATLQAFKSGARHNDLYSRMRGIAQSLSDEEITELGYYYQNIKK